MTRNNEGKNGRALPRLAAAALGALMISCLGLMAAPTAFAEEVNDLPGTYQLPLKASEAASRIAEAPSYASEASASSKTAAPAETTAPAEAADPAEATAPAETSATTGASAPTETSATTEATAPTEATDPAKSATDSATSTDARAAGETRAAREAQAADSKATPTAVTPATFTISGMKFLEGRALEAGEFTFKLAPAGAAQVSARSDLPRKLRPPSTLTDAEKYELVAHGDLVYYPSALQPMPASDTTQNNADGQVSFGPLTFDLSCLGETSTQRHQGTVFCYTVAEEPPRNADGTLADGVTKDERGRCVYQGVTYDDSVKRIYIYAYETGDDSGNPEIEIIPLGDATFDAHPAKAGAGLGAGFLNVFNGAVLESYDGAVYLADEPITAGEFNFEVREVAEDGTILDDLSVPCEAAENGSEGAGVHLITDEIYGEPGRFFYTVRQTAAARTDGSDIVLDESSYVITVEVTQGADDDLQAAITYVRKKPAGSDQWVDVALDTQPSPVTWENRVKSPDEPDNPDNPDSPGESGSGSGSATTPGGDTGAATRPDEPGDDAGGTTKPDAGQSPDATEPDDGAHADNPTGASKPESGTSAESSSSQGGSSASSSAPDKGTGASSNDSASAAAASGAATAKSTVKPSGAFAQTGDDLGVPMLIAFLIVMASGVVLAIVSRRRTPRS
ncbi:FctA domain-containing protein [uncultured Adlercreutzia sp.]|uniref:Spy0128 family protein n=1 Tax=uncultured Adlercreutzia sp. TaxID=875803 RepID=UPI0026758DC6|nr:FctA domain-containing protein [uncultured Adlercreutzia sp.]